MSRGPRRAFPECVASAHVIFVGVVREVSENAPAQAGDPRRFAVRFSVDQMLKGEPATELVVHADSSTNGVAAGMTAGRHMVIFASGEPLATAAHSGTRVLASDADRDRVIADVRQATAR